MDYLSVLRIAYQLYMSDWCKRHGYKRDTFDETARRISGRECYSTLAEFERGEFQSELYMKELFREAEKLYAYWTGKDKLKPLWIEQQVCNWHSFQQAGFFSQCPRCGGHMREKLSYNCLSRRATIYICEPCGMSEAVEDACKAKNPDFVKKPLSEWYFIANFVDKI